MRPVIVAAVALACATGNAAASAGFGCRAIDKNVARLELEGVTPRDGTSLVQFNGAVEVVAGQKIELDKADVVKFAWRKGIRLDIRKQLAQKSFVEIRIRTHPGKDEMSFSGTYSVRTDVIRRNGHIDCEGG